MAGKNPFELSARRGVGPPRPAAANTWTPEEQVARLVGYIEVAPEHWDQVRYSTHVRYYTKDGKYHPGGFVKNNPYDVKPRGGAEEKRFMRLQTGFEERAPSYINWLVAFEDLDKVYMKVDAGYLTVMASLEAVTRGLNENIRKVADLAKKLDQRVAALERT